MTSSMTKASGFLIPEERALAMVQACAAQLAQVATIPDVLKVVSQADAIAAVMSKIKASDEVRKAALRLRVDAEVQLGRITSQIQKGRPGKKRPGFVPPPTKGAVLRAHDIEPARAGLAERLARTPPERIRNSVDRVKSTALTAVLEDLGYQRRYAKGFV